MEILSFLETTLILQLAMGSKGLLTEKKWQTSALAFSPQPVHVKGQGEWLADGPT